MHNIDLWKYKIENISHYLIFKKVISNLKEKDVMRKIKNILDEISDGFSLFFYNISYSIFFSIWIISFCVCAIFINKDWFDILATISTFWSFVILIIQLWRDSVDRSVENAFKRIELIDSHLTIKRFLNEGQNEYCNNIKFKILKNSTLSDDEIQWCKIKISSYEGLLEDLSLLKKYKIPKTIFYYNYIINHLINSNIYAFYLDIKEYSKYDNCLKEEVDKCNEIFRKL